MAGPGERTVKMSALCLLCLSLFPSFSLGRVVGKDEAGFAECNVFFPGRVPPEGFTEPFHVKICQQYNGEPRFATLYSTKDKIPLYSAFKYTGAARSEADESWLLEPQIDDPENDQREMVIEADVVGSLANLGANQALTSDYVGSGYERGLLNPSLLNKEDFQMATYTLTNAVPLHPSLSKTWHSDIKRVVEQALIPHCSKKDQLYLLAGAIPSSVRVKGKVSVPEILWLAACCDAPQGWSLGLVKKVSDESSLVDLTVGELEKQLLAGLDLFKGNCGEDNESSEKMEAILQAVSQIRSGEQVGTNDKEAKDSGLVGKIVGIIATPFIKLLELLIYLLVELVKFMFYFLWLVIKRVGSTLLDGVYSMWNGTVSYLKAISMVLISIPCDVGRVITNIFLGFLGIIQDVAVIAYRILRIPVGFVLHLASFPYYSICAIPSVVKDMAAGIGGTFSLAIDATASILHGFYYVACHIAKRFVPKGSSAD
ncbi:endonuclease domain-containing 1 protein [Tympanuchus pallidicinctus]|uniref:endonuclease domain-containing 1 protein n=1 Tax=Tympanuchus pallidicinctus TaxID=109042 RepID=UPI002286E580|nr:endonuclease domain-containing 1 protein [Tympanuchus pallidicinctus]